MSYRHQKARGGNPPVWFCVRHSVLPLADRSQEVGAPLHSPSMSVKIRVIVNEICCHFLTSSLPSPARGHRNENTARSVVVFRTEADQVLFNRASQSREVPTKFRVLASQKIPPLMHPSRRRAGYSSASDGRRSRVRHDSHNLLPAAVAHKQNIQQDEAAP